MRVLSIGIETYCKVDLSRCGIYRYAEDDSFEVLLFAHSVDGQAVHVVDLACGQAVPEAILDALDDPRVEKWAFNATFEWVCLSRMLHDMGRFNGGCYLNPAGWRCTMVRAAAAGLPLSLEGAGSAHHIERGKLACGKDLIRYFSQPCASTKTNGGRTCNLPAHALERWEAFKAYNARDVEAEMELQQRLSGLQPAPSMWDEYMLDQRELTTVASSSTLCSSLAPSKLTPAHARRPRSVCAA